MKTSNQDSDQWVIKRGDLYLTAYAGMIRMQWSANRGEAKLLPLETASDIAKDLNEDNGDVWYYGEAEVVRCDEVIP
jgi:hypothetical protein